MHSSNVLRNLDQLPLFDHQKRALRQVKDWFENESKRIGLVVIPTGGGKSVIAALAPYVLNTTRVLVITPSKEITKQLADDFGYLNDFHILNGLIGLYIDVYLGRAVMSNLRL